MYPRSSCLNCSFSEELGNTETNTQIRRVLAHGAILSLGTSPAPLRERVDSPWVSPLGPTFDYMCQFRFLSVFMFLHRVLCVCSQHPEGVTLPEDK
jgi:hypothetical protein